MWHWWDNPFDPRWSIALVGLVCAVASAISYLVPFYRRELVVEDKSRLTPLDGMRGILCYAVMCTHTAMTFTYLDTGRWDTPASRFYALAGITAVSFFFCITAFLFWSRILDRGSMPTWTFLRARLFRIAPLYLFACVVALAIVGSQIRWLSSATVLGLGRMSLLGVLRWGHIGAADVALTNCGVSWSLKYEWGFYVALPALAMIVGDGRSRRLLLLAAAAFIVFDPGPAFLFLPGILAAYAVRNPRIVQWLRSPAVSAAVLILAGAFTMLIGQSSYDARALLVVSLIFVPIACGNSLFGLLNLRGLKLMGIVSYSVYLLHGFSLYLARPLLAAAKREPTHAAAWYWLAIVGCACATLIVSLITFRWIEWPFMEMEKSLRRKGRSSTVFAAVPVTERPLPGIAAAEIALAKSEQADGDVLLADPVASLSV